MRRNNSRGLAKGDVVKIAFAVVAIIGAIAYVSIHVMSEQGHEVKRVNLPPGSSAKMQAMKRMKGGGGDQSGGFVGGSGQPAGAPPQNGGDRSQDSRGGN